MDTSLVRAKCQGFLSVSSLASIVLCWPALYTAGRRNSSHIVCSVLATFCLDKSVCFCYDITHTHPFNGPLSVSQHQKGKDNLDFTEARDPEWQWHQLGHMQVCTSLHTDNHASTPPLSFYRPDALAFVEPAARSVLNIYIISKYINRVEFCNRSNFCRPSRSYAT